MSAPYHHGDLRAAILAAAAKAVVEVGPNHVSLRALAREAGVSHTAPRHHFGDKLGVTTALAEEGYRLLDAELRAGDVEGGLLEMGVAYVRFARRHRGHFAVMFQPDLVRDSDDMADVSASPYTTLREAVLRDVPGQDPDLASLRRWSTAHGLATLATSGRMRDLPDEELFQLTRRVLTDLGAGG